MADLLERWAARLDTVNAAVGLTVRWVAVGMLVIQFASVVLRYVFGTSEIFVQESVLYLHAALLMLGAGYTLAVEGHVRVDIFYGEASPRRKAAVDLIGTLVFLVPACVAILRYSWPSMIRSWQILEGPISVGGIPASFLLKSLIPAFAALLLIQGAALALRSAAVLAAGTTRESGTP
ncbi:MAG: TRAP transporter small permease subunit [Azospirillaceae bacterium]